MNKKMDSSGFGSRSVRKLYGDDLILSNDEYVDKYLPYVLKKAGSRKEDDDSFERMLKNYFRKMIDLEKGIEAITEENSDLFEARKRAVDLLLVQDFLLRGDGR